MLYELQFELPLVLFVPFLLMLFFFFAPHLSNYFNELRVEQGKEPSEPFSPKMRIAGCLFCAVIAVLLLADHLMSWRRVSDMYHAGNYLIAEGTVEQFHPMPPQGKGQESFVVDGVTFAYSSNVPQIGYYQVQSRGGVITGNGQRLRIGYIYRLYEGTNTILFIEELTD